MSIDYAGLAALWRPTDRLSLSEWSERHLVLSSEYSARSGPIRLYEFQRGVFDAYTTPGVKVIVLMCSTQLLKTLLLQAIIAYTIANDPLPMLVIQPKDEAAKKFSKRRLSPMFRDCEILRGRVSEPGPGREGTIQDRTFAGGSLSIVGAGSPTNLASASVAIVLADEIDKYEVNVGNHGDPIAQAKARLSTYGSRAKIVMVCSPTDEHTSRIAKEYEISDQRQAWVPCHACGEFQMLKWGQVRFNKAPTIDARARSARYECEVCGSTWNDAQRWESCNRLEWRAEKPFEGIAGFHLSHLYSPWHKLSDLVGDFLRSKNSWTERKTFVNNTLAELWKQDGVSPQEEKLFARREKYPFNENAVLPERVLFLTAAVDVQEDRLEVEVIGWGRDKESWSIAYEVIRVMAADGITPLPSTSHALWNELDRRILGRDWQHAAGATLPVMCMAIDTGYNAAAVYEYVSRHTQPGYSPANGMRVGSVRTVVSVRGGDSDVKIIESVSTPDAARKRKGNIQIVTVGTHCVKSELYELLRNVVPVGDDPVPNCRHFPEYELTYFKGLCAEHRLVKPNGTHEWKKKSPNARNEPLDLAVYSRAAATLCGIDRATEQHWQRLEADLNIRRSLPEPSAPAAAPAARRVRGSFI